MCEQFSWPYSVHAAFRLHAWRLSESGAIIRRYHPEDRQCCKQFADENIFCDSFAVPKHDPDGEIFRLLPTLYPAFIGILKKCELKGSEFFALSYIRHFGVQHNDERVILTSVLNDVLMTVLYETEGGSSGFISRLANRHLVRRAFLTESEKLAMFDDATGSKAVVVLAREGVNRLDQFNHEVLSLFNNLAGRDARMTRKTLLFLAQRFARMVLPSENQPIRRKREAME